MKFIDRNKLQVAMVKNGLKIKDISEELCSSYQCVYYKIKNNRNFTEEEIVRLTELFGKDIFFCS